MTGTTWGAAPRKAIGGIVALLSGRLPFLITIGCVLLLNWSTALWLLHYMYHEREATAIQLASDEIKYSEQKIAGLLRDADRMLLELRALHAGDGYSGDGVKPELGGWTPTSQSGGIALITPDGHVVAASPNASTAGWPYLMSRLAKSDDVMTIGEPVLSKTGHLGFLPLARRIVRPDGSFGGILMYSLESESLPALSPAVAALDGCISLVSDDGVVLARTPDVRGHRGHPGPEIGEQGPPAWRRDRHGAQREPDRRGRQDFRHPSPGRRASLDHRGDRLRRHVRWLANDRVDRPRRPGWRDGDDPAGGLSLVHAPPPRPDLGRGVNDDTCQYRARHSCRRQSGRRDCRQ